MSIPNKTCYKCKKTKSLSKFHRDGNPKDGVRSLCKTCACKYRKERYKIAIISDMTRFKGAIASAKVRKHVWEFTFEEWSLLVLGDDKRCTYCLGPLPVGGSALDRMDNSQGYIKGNVTPCCRACNEAKGNIFSSEEFKTITAMIRIMRAIPDGEPIVLSKSTKIPKKISYPARKLTPHPKPKDPPKQELPPTLKHLWN